MTNWDRSAFRYFDSPMREEELRRQENFEHIRSCLLAFPDSHFVLGNRKYFLNLDKKLCYEIDNDVENLKKQNAALQIALIRAEGLNK